MHASACLLAICHTLHVLNFTVTSVQSLSSVWLCNPMDFSRPCFLVHHQLPELAETSCPSSWWCHPTISSSIVSFPSCLQSFPASGSFQMSQFFASGRQMDATIWSFSFSINPSNEYSGLISFRMDWFDFLAVQGTLESLLQDHSSKASILWHSAFFTVQLSHPYMTTGKTIVLTRWTFVGKVMSLLFTLTWALWNHLVPTVTDNQTRLPWAQS